MRVTGAGTKLPSLERLDEEGVSAIHEASMRVLEDLGVEVDNERARAVFAEHGCAVDEEDVVTLPRDLVEECVRTAPSEFTLHARNPDRNVVVGGDSPPVRAPGVGPRHVHTLSDGRRESRLSDYESLLKLAQVEDVITCTGYRLCEPGNSRSGGRPAELLERALTLTDKPVMGSARGTERAETCMDMLAIAMDDPGLSDPCVAGVVNTSPPRRIDAEMLGGLLTYAENGQPPIVSSFTMAGASGPSTLAGSMVQTNAETLVGVTLTQLVNPGTPVIYGVPSANVDTRYGSLSIGSPESALFVSFAAQMGRHYDIPSRAGGALSDAKSVDYQSGFESALLGMVTALSNVDFVLFAAGILESYAAISPEKFALDCEAIRHVDRFRSGYSVDEESLALDPIAETEPAGHFVDDGEGGDDGCGFFRSTVFDKRSYEDWAEDGRKSAFEMGHDRVVACLDGYERPRIDPDVERDLARYVEQHAPE